MAMHETKCPEGSRIYVATLLGHFQTKKVVDEDDEDDNPEGVREVPSATKFLIAAPSQEIAEMFAIHQGLYKVMDGSYADLMPVLAKGQVGRNVDVVLDEIGNTPVMAKLMHEYHAQWREIAKQHRVYGRPTVDDEALPVINPGDAEGRTWQIQFEDIDRLWQRCIVEAASAEKALAAFDDHPMSYPIRINRFDERAKRYATPIEKGEVIPGLDNIKATTKMWLTADGTLKPDDHIGYLAPLLIGGKHPWYVNSVRVTECAAQYRLPNGSFISAVEFCTPVACTYCACDASQERIKVANDPGVYCSGACADAAHGQYILVSQSKAGKTQIAFGPVAGLQATRDHAKHMGDAFNRFMLLRPIEQKTIGDPTDPDDEEPVRGKKSAKPKRRYGG